MVVIGGGAAGMVCAIAAARNGAKVLLLEKMERPGVRSSSQAKGDVISQTQNHGLSSLPI